MDWIVLPGENQLDPVDPYAVCYVVRCNGESCVVKCVIIEWIVATASFEWLGQVPACSEALSCLHEAMLCAEQGPACKECVQWPEFLWKMAE